MGVALRGRQSVPKTGRVAPNAEPVLRIVGASCGHLVMPARSVFMATVPTWPTKLRTSDGGD